MRSSTGMMSWLGACLAALALCGCAGKNAGTGGSSGGAGALTGTEWVLVDLEGAPAVGDAAGRPSLRLDAQQHRVTGSTGVNQMGGEYELSGDAMKFGSLAMTRRAGPPEMMKQESAFVDALGRAARARVSGSTLRLLEGGGREVARFVARDAPR